MTIYISGPMRGKPFFNFAEFDEASIQLREAGHTPVSPAEMDRLRVREAGLDEHDEASYLKITKERCMEEDIIAMSHVDAVVLLPGYEKSKGAKVEIAYAEYRGIPVYRLEDFLFLARTAQAA